MRTRYWILILAIVLAVSLATSLFLLQPGEPAQAVQVYSQGKLLYTLSLQQDQTVTVKTDRGTNTVTVRDGKVAVTQADCPDGHCMARGWCSSGRQIVCLPNRLVLQFTGWGALDGIAG